jgi:hypothetical protein
MYDRAKEDTADKIGIVIFSMIILAYVLFWLGLFLCAVKLFWWILFVL